MMTRKDAVFCWTCLLIVMYGPILILFAAGCASINYSSPLPDGSGAADLANIIAGGSLDVQGGDIIVPPGYVWGGTPPMTLPSHQQTPLPPDPVILKLQEDQQQMLATQNQMIAAINRLTQQVSTFIINDDDEQQGEP